MRRLKDGLACVFGGLLVFCLVALCVLSILTPQKDKFGQYTQPLEYWINSEYIKSHF